MHSGGRESRSEFDEVEGMVEDMMDEDGNADSEPAFDLKEIQPVLEALEGARYMLEALLRGERCPFCKVTHDWSGRTLWYAGTILKMRALGEAEVALYLEVIIDDESELRKSGFTSRTQAERLLARLRDLLSWAEQ